MEQNGRKCRVAGFYGRYEVTMDAKGRILLPARLKKQLPEGEDVLILNWGDDGCINLFTKSDWDKEVEKIRLVDEDESEEKRRFKRHIIGGAYPMDVDTAGRISLPKYLAQHASVSKDIMLNCNDNRIEIWDLDRFNKFFEGFGHADYTQKKAEFLSKKPIAAS